MWDGVVDWQNFNFEAKKLKDVFDLSIGADYKVNDQISAFALLDNVAHQKYMLYYNYPVTGIQFYAGVKLRFWFFKHELSVIYHEFSRNCFWKFVFDSWKFVYKDKKP